MSFQRHEGNPQGVGRKQKGTKTEDLRDGHIANVSHNFVLCSLSSLPSFLALLLGLERIPRGLCPILSEHTTKKQTQSYKKIWPVLVPKRKPGASSYRKRKSS